MPSFTLTRKPLSWFKKNPTNRKPGDEQKLRHLGKSLRTGQANPVLTQPDGEIIAGNRRFEAALLDGLTELEVKIADQQLSESEAKLWQLTENLHREDLTGYEKWQGCAELLALNPTWTAKELADYLNLDPSSITRNLSPSKTIPEAQEALKQGLIGISDSYALSKEALEDQPAFLQMKLAGASRDALESARRKARNGTKSAVRVRSVRCVLPSGVKIVVTGGSISLDTLIDSLGEAAKQARKARKQGLDAKTFQAVMSAKQKKGEA